MNKTDKKNTVSMCVRDYIKRFVRNEQKNCCKYNMI